MIQILVDQINKKHQLIESKENITINDIFENVKQLPEGITPPQNIIFSVNKKQTKRGRPCKIGKMFAPHTLEI